MKGDISKQEDIELLVDTFYERVFKDEMLSPHFTDVDFPAHRPKMISFWCFVLLGVPGYTTNVFQKHTHLHIGQQHFDRWVAVFHETIDDLFDGETASDAKFRATSLGWTFGHKMEQLRSPGN